MYVARLSRYIGKVSSKFRNVNELQDISYNYICFTITIKIFKQPIILCINKPSYSMKTFLKIIIYMLLYTNLVLSKFQQYNHNKLSLITVSVKF